MRHPWTFEETRPHLGVETQRQWSDQAIANRFRGYLHEFGLFIPVGLGETSAFIFRRG